MMQLHVACFELLTDMEKADKETTLNLQLSVT